MPLHTTPDVDRIRGAFPALSTDLVFLENAGGSQVPAAVVDRMSTYLRETYVQLGAPYELSQRATATVDAAHGFVRELMNAGSAGHVILGPSTTQLCRTLAACYRRALEPGDEIILAESGHEANRGPWAELAHDGLTITTWPADPVTGSCHPDTLAPLLSERTRLVAFPHVSNLLGAIEPVEEITRLVHAAGAQVVVDGVAFAPHRAIDVTAWNVDWYVYSTYKVYGPHMAALFGRHEAIAGLRGPNHFFIPDDAIPYKFEPGGVSHEGCAGILGLGDYLNVLAGRTAEAPLTRATIDDAFGHMTDLETPLVERIMLDLARRPGVRVIGPAAADPDERVGTISFVHETMSSLEIAEAVCRRGVAIRNGHMYAYDLCRRLGIEPEDGVVRISLVHYNTTDEIDRLIAALDEVLPPA